MHVADVGPGPQWLTNPRSEPGTLQQLAREEASTRLAYLEAKARLLIEAHWYLVEALVEPLVERGTLSGPVGNGLPTLVPQLCLLAGRQSRRRVTPCVRAKCASAPLGRPRGIFGMRRRRTDDHEPEPASPNRVSYPTGVNPASGCTNTFPMQIRDRA
jgi:hypothetical protein